MLVKIKKTHKDAVVPFYATKGAACFDITTVEAGKVDHYPYIFHTGLEFEIPEGHVMLLYSRSGHAFSRDVRLANCVGVIDSDYRGELKVKLTNDSMKSYEVKKGERIAQAMVVPVQQVLFEVEEELSGTERGKNGFGSTG